MFEDGGRLVNEFFNFRINDIPDEIFNTPELTPCKVSIKASLVQAGILFQTTNLPKIPDMSSSFHAKMEITDRIGHKGVWNEIYDFNIHYDRELRIGFFIHLKLNDRI